MRHAGAVAGRGGSIGVEAALTEVRELWIIMYSVDRRFKDLLA